MPASRESRLANPHRPAGTRTRREPSRWMFSSCVPSVRWCGPMTHDTLSVSSQVVWLANRSGHPFTAPARSLGASGSDPTATSISRKRARPRTQRCVAATRASVSSLVRRPPPAVQVARLSLKVAGSMRPWEDSSSASTPLMDVPSEWLCESSMRWLSAGQRVILARALPDGLWGACGAEGAGVDVVGVAENVPEADQLGSADPEAQRIGSAGGVGPDRWAPRADEPLEADVHEERRAVADDRTAQRDRQLLGRKLLRPGCRTSPCR